MTEEQTDNTFFETQIDKFNFRYRGGTVIEVSYVSDRNKTPIYEIVTKDSLSQKQFHSEISFWYMKEAINY